MALIIITIQDADASDLDVAQRPGAGAVQVQLQSEPAAIIGDAADSPAAAVASVMLAAAQQSIAEHNAEHASQN